MTTKKVALYLVNLEFKTETVGGGSMELQLAVNPSSEELIGRAEGNILEGTQGAPSFIADASGQIYHTGLVTDTVLGGVTGQALVSVGVAPGIGSYLADFSATFAVNKDWNGTGEFKVGSNTYKCKVTVVK